MIQRPASRGIFFWNGKEDGFSSSSSSDEFQNSLLGSVNAKEGVLGEFDGSRAEPKRIKLMGLNQQSNLQVGALVNLSESVESSPLGLTLRKTPSFLDLIETKLAQGRKTTTPTETNQITDLEEVRTRTDDLITQRIAEKLKASNISALSIKIGSWEVVSRYEGDLVAKCYYAKRKLVWEVLEHGLKSKIEIQWSDISAIRATFRDNEPGILEFELNHVPMFFRETNPQPRKHTFWQTTSDFTGNQARICRRHYLQFPEGTLEKHYEKLLQCDSRLLMLSQRPFPTLNSPYFDSGHSGYQDISFEFNGHQPEFPPGLQFPHLGIQKPTLVPSHQIQNFEPTMRPSVGAKDSTSSMSVTNIPRIEENGVNHGNEHQRSLFWGQGIRNGEISHRGRADQVRELPSIASDTQSDPFLPHQGSSQLLSSGDISGRFPSKDCTLEEIADQLLNDTLPSVCSDEQRVLARVKSMSSLLEPSRELNPIENIGINNPMVLRNNGQSNGHGVLPSPESVSELPPLGSNEDLLMHIPRNMPSPYLFLNQTSENFAGVKSTNAVNQVRGGR